MLMFSELNRTGLIRSPFPTRTSRVSESGQATAEYALVIVGAATLAALVIAWAASSGSISRLLNAVMDAVIGKIA